jgi:hypothetical protein
MDRRKFLKWGSSIIPIAGALSSVAMERIGREKASYGFWFHGAVRLYINFSRYP